MGPQLSWLAKELGDGPESGGGLLLGGERQPKMMSVGLHGRISGHPACAMALARFLDYVQEHDRVWVCRREEIAWHWAAVHPPGSRANPP